MNPEALQGSTPCDLRYSTIKAAKLQAVLVLTLGRCLEVVSKGVGPCREFGGVPRLRVIASHSPSAAGGKAKQSPLPEIAASPPAPRKDRWGESLETVSAVSFLSTLFTTGFPLPVSTRTSSAGMT